MARRRQVREPVEGVIPRLRGARDRLQERLGSHHSVCPRRAGATLARTGRDHEASQAAPGAVLGWALAQGFRDDNPARSEALTAALPKQPAGGHQRALPPAAVAAIRAGTASPVVKLAVEFVVLTGDRSGEARNAAWDEIDGDTWTIPGQRTKTGKPHRVPLPGRAQAVLTEVRHLGQGAGLIFAAPAPVSRSATTPSARHYEPPRSQRPSTACEPALETGLQPKACPTNWPKPCWPTSLEASPSPTGAMTYSKHGAPSWNAGRNTSYGRA